MNWTIIGCGWLGTSLAETLLRDGEAVIGTCTSSENQISLEKKGIKSVVFTTYSQFSTEIIDFSEIVVLSIPPFNKTNPTDYSNSLVQIVKQFKPNTQFIFLGSIGIYPQKTGSYVEDYDFELEEQESALYIAEKELGTFLKQRLTILRLGGLFGDDRHPIYHLAGKSNLKNPLGKINFAGKEDIILIIQQLVNQEKLGQVYNIVFPEHPTREIYYTQTAENFKLTPPNFEYNNSIVREISSEKIQKALNYSFHHKI